MQLSAREHTECRNMSLHPNCQCHAIYLLVHIRYSDSLDPDYLCESNSDLGCQLYRNKNLPKSSHRVSIDGGTTRPTLHPKPQPDGLNPYSMLQPLALTAPSS